MVGVGESAALLGCMVEPLSTRRAYIEFPLSGGEEVNKAAIIDASIEC
jgi:hypothetical protein